MDSDIPRPPSRTPRSGRGVNARIRRPPPSPNAPAVVQRPLPAQRNSRGFQISQIQRRFRDNCKADKDNVRFTINLTPSDPDFPYSIDTLTFTLTVPAEYRSSTGSNAGNEAVPSIEVLNEDIPVGFKANIEKGFRSIAEAATENTTLLDIINRFDRRLESFLAEEKATTFKIVRHQKADSPTPSNDEDAGRVPPLTPSASDTKTRDDKAPRVPTPPIMVAQRNYTPAEREAAAAKRAVDCRGLEARMRTSAAFSKSEIAGATTYVLPLIPRKRESLPEYLQKLSTVRVFVPAAYPLEPCSIELMGVDPISARPLETKFEELSKLNTSWSIMAHLNSFSANLHSYVKEAEATKQKHAEIISASEERKLVTEQEKQAALVADAKPLIAPADQDDRTHIHVIPRPPEWDYGDSDSDDWDEDYSDEEHEKHEEHSDEDGRTEQVSDNDEEPQEHREHGTSLSFPGISMKGIQLLEVVLFSVTIRCTRCKTDCDVSNIKPDADPIVNSCSKCSNILSIGFRKELIHENSSRAGFFDLVGCTIAVFLPSVLSPHCSACGAAASSPGITGFVPAQTYSTNCRECHGKMSLYAPEFKLRRITQEEDNIDLSHVKLPKKTKEDKNYTVGTELPSRGTCIHYRKSTRWFRFSCCLKVFPCDKCHDEKVQPQHYAEHANRMICGKCSREQTYKPDKCGFCGHYFIRRQTGYWEGGKGTRDKALLRRNDPRKHRRTNMRARKT